MTSPTAEQAEWTTIVPKTSVKDQASRANVRLPLTVTDRPFTHIRVKIYPCGGVHRIRAIGKVSPDR